MKNIYRLIPYTLLFVLVPLLIIAQPDPPDPPPPPAPLESGWAFLILAGLLYGFYRFRKAKRNEFDNTMAITKTTIMKKNSHKQ